MLPCSREEKMEMRRSLSDLFLTYVSSGSVMQVAELFDRPGFLIGDVLQTASPLHIATERRDYAMIQLLLEKGIPSTLIDSSDRGTVLHRAAAIDEPGAIRLVVSAGCPIDSVDVNGMTPLHIAAYWGCPSSAKVLIELGATTDALDIQCKPPRYWSDTRGHSEVSVLLPEYKLDWRTVVRQEQMITKKMKITKVPKVKKKKKGKGKK